MLQAHRMDTMPNGRTLTFGDYHDISRPLRRFLKQLGSGSLDEGLRMARFNENQRRELAKICDLDEQVSPPPPSPPSLQILEDVLPNIICWNALKATRCLYPAQLLMMLFTALWHVAGHPGLDQLCAP